MLRRRQAVDHAQDVSSRHSTLERDFHRFLDRGAVHEWVGVRETDLQQVDAGVEHGLKDLDTVIDRGEPRREVADEC